MMKRKATAEGNTITSLCMPYELQGQISEFNKVIAETNGSNRTMVSREESTKRNEAEARQALSDLTDTLTYE